MIEYNPVSLIPAPGNPAVLIFLTCAPYRSVEIFGNRFKNVFFMGKMAFIMSWEVRISARPAGSSDKASSKSTLDPCGTFMYCWTVIGKAAVAGCFVRSVVDGRLRVATSAAVRAGSSSGSKIIRAI
jgi:hypothetical protein